MPYNSWSVRAAMAAAALYRPCPAAQVPAARWEAVGGRGEMWGGGARHAESREAGVTAEERG